MAAGMALAVSDQALGLWQTPPAEVAGLTVGQGRVGLAAQLGNDPTNRLVASGADPISVDLLIDSAASDQLALGETLYFPLTIEARAEGNLGLSLDVALPQTSGDIAIAWHDLADGGGCEAGNPPASSATTPPGVADGVGIPADRSSSTDTFQYCLAVTSDSGSAPFIGGASITVDSLLGSQTATSDGLVTSVLRSPRQTQHTILIHHSIFRE
jgi:hypothetical protein